MQRVYGELIIPATDTNDVISAIKTYETNLDLNKVPDRLVLRKLGIKVNATCQVAINGREFLINAGEALEFGYDSIKVHSIVFKTTGINAIVRYMYFREDKVYQ
jgi:hypothetical protein